MKLSQDLLRTTAAERIRSRRPDLDHLELSTMDGFRAAREEIDGRDGALAVVVIRRFAITSWVAETCRFAAGVPAGPAAAWQRSFTRTVFLAGNPDNLRERFRFDHLAPDGTAAWLGPAPAARSAPLRRLLKVFHSDRGLPTQPPLTVRIPGGRPGRPAGRRRLYLATAGLTISGCLVHLNHLLAEAVLDGLVERGDELDLRLRPRLAGIGEPFTALRISTDHADPCRLQAYAGLTEET